MSDNDAFVEALFFDEEIDDENLEDAGFFFEDDVFDNFTNENDLEGLKSEDCTESLLEFEQEEVCEKLVGAQKEKDLREELSRMIEDVEVKVEKQTSDLQRISEREAFLDQFCPLLLERQVAFREKTDGPKFQRSQFGLRKTSSP